MASDKAKLYTPMEFLDDLGKNEKVFKKEDEDLKKDKIIVKHDIPLCTKKKRTKKTPKKQPETINAYDFDAWSKYNVDAAVDKVDEESEESDYSEEEYLKELEISKQKRKIKRANLEKDKGNKLFKEAQYEAAIKCYTTGIELDPNNPILSANRAMALIKIESYGDAEEDCTASLKLDPTYVKALARRATVRQKLGKLKLAKMDYNEILVLQPNNTQAITELKKINKDLDDVFSNCKVIKFV